MKEGKVKSSLPTRQVLENLVTQFCGVNYYQLLAVMLLKLPNMKLPVAADYTQLQTMASELDVPID